MVYSGELFGDWHGDLIAAGLSSRALVRLEIRGDEASEADRYPNSGTGTTLP